VVSLLIGRTSAGARVQGTRLDPYKKHELPAISVYTPDEQGDPDSVKSTREITRDLQLEIVIFADIGRLRPEDDAMNPMDALAKQIEAVIAVDPFLLGAASDSVYQSTEVSFQHKADPPVGVVTLTYAVEYRTAPATGTLDDFLRANVTTQVDGAGADNAAHDQINVRGAP
jgi:hypothetical protein